MATYSDPTETLQALRERLAQMEGEKEELGHKWVNACDKGHNLERERDALRAQLAAMGRVVEAGQVVVDSIENKVLDYSAVCALRDALQALRAGGVQS